MQARLTALEAQRIKEAAAKAKAAKQAALLEARKQREAKKGKESWSHWLCVEESQECTAAQYADIWPRKDKDDAKLAADVAAEAAAAVKAPKDET